ncbi:unnamed protein product [Caenorhabditis bovis]|uniref:Cortactin-binding protein-2 N-terminal domain-containing protein n=1 Tax=Caenorhabditis bovis TaxID=2654633 RepID=A0A8S1F7K3_9PELO|nr:unnamed protein product [Caenorhabditis bovis]
MSNDVGEEYDETFQSTSKKIDLTKAFGFDGFQETATVNDFTNEELIRLLAFMEGELEAREDAIESLKRERTKILLAEAKYGKISLNDPFSALRRDSAINNEMFNEDQIVEMYESQVEQLEKLIKVQKKSQKQAAMLLASLDKKHYKLVKKLEADRKAQIEYAKQGDDVVAMLEKERSNLNQKIEFHIEEARKFQEERDKMEMKMVSEKKRHEAIVLYLIQERKQLLLKMHELRVNAEQLLQQQQQQQQPGSSTASISDRELIEELKKEVTFLRGERESLMKTQKMLKTENLSLKETVRGQESDLTALRKNLLSSSKIPEKPTTLLPQLTPDVGGSLIVANRGATISNVRPSSGTAPSRLSTSSSFPMEKSKLPRGPHPPNVASTSHSATVPRNSVTSTRTGVNSSPIKKTPVMGVSSSNVRRPATSSPSTPLTPELEQLEAAIQSMNASPSTTIAATTKLSGTVKRNGILAKAFGSSDKH